MIDTTRPIETIHGKPATILLVEKGGVFPIVGRISDARICSWSVHGEPSTNMAIDKIRNCPIRKKVPISFDTIKEGVLLRNKAGNEVYSPLKMHSKGVTIIWDDSGSLSYLSYEELMELEFQFKRIGAGLRTKQEWTPCYTYLIVPTSTEEEEEEDEETLSN